MQAAFAPLDPPRRLLMGSGPSNPEPRVLAAMSALPPTLADRAFERLLDDAARLMRRTFQTANACTLAVAGASRAGIEAALASLIEPGDLVLVGVYGHFGELLCTLAARHGARVERVDAEWGCVVDPSAMAAAIKARQPKLVAIVHADTSTGVVQPLEELGAACREQGSLFVVDAVLSLGGSEVCVDAWGIDAAIGGLQKCLGGPPGLAPLTCSARAQATWSGRQHAPHSTYLDLARLFSAWLERHELDATPVFSTSMLLALREALLMIDEEGLAVRWMRHQRAKHALVAGLTAMGLQLFGDARFVAPMITLVQVPDDVGEAEVRAQLLGEHAIEIMAAFGPLRGRVWRIGTMGSNARLPSVMAVLSGLEAVLAARGHRLERGAAVDAAADAWRTAPPKC